MSVEPVGNVKRWKRGKGSLNVSQPHAIKAYNKCMGSVDLLDRALSDLRPNFNGKKWYWGLIINTLNLGFACCWRLHQLCSKPNAAMGIGGGIRQCRRKCRPMLVLRRQKKMPS